MICNHPRAARTLLVLSTLTLGASSAGAGPVLLARTSDIRASGASSTGEYALSNSADDFAPFADGLLSDGAAAARSSAQQSSEPLVDAAGGLSGASAEGSARASVDADSAGDSFSDAETDFDLVFRVDGGSAVFTFDGTLAASGDASSGVVLHPKDDAAPPVFSLDVTADERTVRRSTVLEPGTYGLSVWAFARGTPGESAASYAMSVSLADGEPGAVPMPLPAGAWVGLAGLTAVGLITYRRGAPKTATVE